MRNLNATVSQFPCGRYFAYYQGDEFLLQATNDADAIAEGAALIAELESDDQYECDY